MVNRLAASRKINISDRKITKVLTTMTARTGKHFRGDKDLIIHDKTGRVIYLYCYTSYGSDLPCASNVYKVVS